MRKLLFSALLAALPLSAGALELSLEENRGESGTIGYVDIDRVFKEYSGTTGAREEFISEIKKKEESVNGKKTAIYTLKAELSKLRLEREFALTLPSLMETQRSITEAAEVKTSGRQTEAVPVSTQTAAVSTAAPAALPQGLPGLDGIDMPGVAKVPVNRFKFSVSTSVPEIDAALARKEEDIRTKEEELRTFQRLAERELLEYESHKSEILLGRIYVALKELATKEEVSVIVDKRNILYGQNAVDLTGKLLKKLEEDSI
ncbi:MAG TPA: hypothetical protein DCS63_00780 [Elusimicrobia bacterium]|nr:hypothetical protein [Elusimicrobiota bacterium]